MALTPQIAVDELTGQSSLHGLDLTEAEALRLLNEAHTDLCLRAGWTRATLTLTTTVADQADYLLSLADLDIYSIETLNVAGNVYEPTSQDVIRRLRAGTLSLVGDGMYVVRDGSTGLDQVTLFPTPDSSGDSIILDVVYYPTEFAIDGEFAVPPDFRRALMNYVRYIALDSAEDDVDAAIYSSAYEADAERLRQHRIKRRSHGPVTMRIRGITA